MGNASAADYLKIIGELDVDLRSNMPVLFVKGVGRLYPGGYLFLYIGGPVVDDIDQCFRELHRHDNKSTCQQKERCRRSLDHPNPSKNLKLSLIDGRKASFILEDAFFDGATGNSRSSNRSDLTTRCNH
jgi:hypothetical protein